MKLVSSKKKKITTLLIIVGVLVLVGIGLLIFSLLGNKTPETPTTIRSISMYSHPKTEYYVGEEFDSTGTIIQVITNKLGEDYFVGEKELTFSGFDSSVVKDNVVITVTYKEYTTTFSVKIKEIPTDSKDPVLTSIRLSDNFVDTYSLNWWNNIGPAFDNVKLVLVYSDGSEKEVPMQSSYCYNLTFGLTSAGTTDFIIKYNDGGVIVETTVTVTITN